MARTARRGPRNPSRLDRTQTMLSGFLDQRCRGTFGMYHGVGPGVVRSTDIYGADQKATASDTGQAQSSASDRCELAVSERAARTEDDLAKCFSGEPSRNE